MNQSGPTVVTITHHKSPAAARRAKSQRSGQLHEVREVRESDTTSYFALEKTVKSDKSILLFVSYSV